MLQRRYPAALTADDVTTIAKDLDFRLQSGTRLRAAKLVNADEPDTTFRP